MLTSPSHYSKKKLKTLAIACLLFIFFMTGCTKTLQETHPNYYGSLKLPSNPKEIVLGANVEPPGLDPTMDNNSETAFHARNLFVKLTEVHPTDNNVVGDLATHWDVSKDGTEYIFHLRKDAKWSDGIKITANDVVYGWQRLIAPGSRALYSQFGDIIMGGKAYRTQAQIIENMDEKSKDYVYSYIKNIDPNANIIRQGKKQWIIQFSNKLKSQSNFKITILNLQNALKKKNIIISTASKKHLQIKALDKHRFWVKLVSPAKYFTRLITYEAFAPVPKHIIEKFIKKTGSDEGWTNADNIVVSGPYMLTEEVFKQYKVYQKNPKYFNAEHIKIEKITVKYFGNRKSSMDAYKNGEHLYNEASDPPVEFHSKLRKFKDYRPYPLLANTMIVVNTNISPLDNKLVRQALSLSIDRKLLCESVMKGSSIPSYDHVIDGIAGYQTLASPLTNISKAQLLLTEAGYPNGNGIPTLQVKIRSNSPDKLWVAIQQMWKKHLGIQIELIKIEPKLFVQTLQEKKYQISSMSWLGDYQDPHTFLNVFHSENPNNFTGWANTDYDKILTDSDRELDEEKRLDLFQQAEVILADEQPAISLYWLQGNALKKPFLKGWWPNYQNYHPWKYMWIDQRWYKGVPRDQDTAKDIPWSS